MLMPSGSTGYRYFSRKENIVEDGLVLNLDAADTLSYPGSGIIWKDVSGNGNDGTLVNGVGYSGDNFGSLSFDGVNDYVTLGQSPSGISFSSGSTILIWVKVLSDTSGLFSNNTVLSKWWDGSIRGFNFVVESTDFSVAWRPQNTETDLSISYTSGTSFINQWISVVMTNSSSQSNLYLNGNLVSSLDTISDSFIRNNNADLRVGRYTHTSLNGYSNSQTAQVSIYNRALTATEIQQNYNALKGRYGL
jgi:hypothetical protein